MYDDLTHTRAHHIRTKARNGRYCIGYMHRHRLTKSEERKKKVYKDAVKRMRFEVLDFILSALQQNCKHGFVAHVNGVTKTVYPRIIALPFDYDEASKVIHTHTKLSTCHRLICCHYIFSDWVNHKGLLSPV